MQFCKTFPVWVSIIKACVLTAMSYIPRTFVCVLRTVWLLKTNHSEKNFAFKNLLWVPDPRTCLLSKERDWKVVTLHGLGWTPTLLLGSSGSVPCGLWLVLWATMWTTNLGFTCIHKKMLFNNCMLLVLWDFCFTTPPHKKTRLSFLTCFFSFLWVLNIERMFES